jgi:hypothetical protein
MKLMIQIPCYNEAGTLAIALAELPREVRGFDQVEWLSLGSLNNRWSPSQKLSSWQSFKAPGEGGPRDLASG